MSEPSEHYIDYMEYLKLVSDRICECGCSLNNIKNRNAIVQHQKTYKHQKLMYEKKKNKELYNNVVQSLKHIEKKHLQTRTFLSV